MGRIDSKSKLFKVYIACNNDFLCMYHVLPPYVPNVFQVIAV